MEPTKIYLVDDQAMTRAAFRALLEGYGEKFEVIGDKGDAREAIREIASLRPDVVLLDITMPGLSGLDAIAQIHGASSKTKIIMLTYHEGQTFVEQALRAGAEGYLCKDSNAAELALAIEAVCRGDPFVSPKVSGGLVSHLRGAESGPPQKSSISCLTPREREVFQLLALGHSNKEVAFKLHMSLGTARKHRENLQTKLDCRSPAELARLAIREGLLSS